MNTWEYDIQTFYPDQGMTLIGNGYIGATIPMDGHGAIGNPLPATAIGLYVGEQEDPAQVPHWLNAMIRLNGEPVRLLHQGFRQRLDLRRGLLVTRYRDATNSIEVEAETFCHRKHRQIGAYRLRLRTLREVSLEILAQLTTKPCSPLPQTTAQPSAERTVAWQLDYGDAANRASQTLALLNVSDNMRFLKREEQDAIGFHVSRKLTAEETVLLEVAVATAWGGNAPSQAESAIAAAMGSGYEALRDSHARAMEELWNGFDVSTGDPFLDRKLKSSMFYILCGYRDDVIFAGTATGVSSGQTWGGSVFWDCEFYLFPALLTFFPGLARNTLLYRHHTLPAATANAASHGQAGARFAWQSKRSGKPFGGQFEDERHITTDIAYAAWWYANAAADESFSRSEGKDLIVAAARNTAALITWNESAKRYDLRGVIPPDEHTFDHYIGKPIDNSAMTNAYAKWILSTAADLLPANESKEANQWRAIAERLFQPRDAKTGVIPEYEGYAGHPIKQADVAHIFFPLHEPVDPEVIRRSAYYYADRERETGLYLTHSPSVYAAALNKVGDVAGVRRFLELAGRNTVGPFEVPRESNYGGPPVLTGAGSFLNLFVFGILGIDSFGATLAAHPTVPDPLARVILHGVHFRGRQYRIEAECGSPKAKIEPI